ncbi:MAG TPA: hypothetical protein VF587_17200 [Solirubrobacteraceae bacterium]
MRIALAIVLLALLPSTASAATLVVDDPAGDATSSFNTTTDLVGLSAVWVDALTVSATFAERPQTLTLDLVMSEASRSESDPSVQTCHPRAPDVVTVIGTNDGGSLEISGVEGRIEVPATWDGNTVRYEFRDERLSRELATRDPFACGSGTAGEDAFYGVFEGKVGKLTPATASAALEDDVRRRFPGSDGGRLDANCPRRTITPEVDGEKASAFCAFTLSGGPRYRMGYAFVRLDSGVPRVSDVTSRTFPRELRFCGITDFSRGFGKPPVVGASLAAWGRNVSCRTARTVARRWRGRARVRGFRCRRTRTGAEFVAVKCTRGRQVVRFESGS